MTNSQQSLVSIHFSRQCAFLTVSCEKHESIRIVVGFHFSYDEELVFRESLQKEMNKGIRFSGSRR